MRGMTPYARIGNAGALLLLVVVLVVAYLRRR